MGLSHVVQHFLRVLESLNELFVFGLHDFMDQIVKSLVVFIVINHSLGRRIYDDFRLVDENNLDCLVTHSKNDCMLRPKPSFYVDQISSI